MKEIKSNKAKVKIYAVILIAAAACSGTVQAQTGGSYAITQSVIASGGGQNSSGGTFAVDGSIGQTVAGQPSGGAPYNVYAGFFAPSNFAPTAASVAVGGRVTAANGAGIRNVTVTLVGADGETRTTFSGAGGAFSFTDVPAGATYIISVAAKRYRFVQNSQIVSVTENVSDIVFTAQNTIYIPLPEILTAPNN